MGLLASAQFIDSKADLALQQTLHFLEMNG
jgi:hypothetical protein